jgi:hypothetical protein
MGEPNKKCLRRLFLIFAKNAKAPTKKTGPGGALICGSSVSDVQEIGGKQAPAQRWPVGKRLQDTVADLVHLGVYPVLVKRSLQIPQNGNLRLGWRKPRPRSGLRSADIRRLPNA